MISKTELLFNYFTKPREAIRYIIDQQSYIFISFIFIFALANHHIATSLKVAISGEALSFYLLGGFLIKLLGTLITLFIIVSLIHFSSDLVGTTGSVSGLFMTFMLSFSPLLFTTPAILLSKSFYSFAIVCLVIWTMVLQIVAIQEIYRLSSSWSFLIYISTLLFLFIVLPIFLVLTFLFSVLLLASMLMV
ncbi:YIP1 family protein [candidate division CSSED10-310 bacterium]|uniref:YIP1 family protein n=1 Tax=candidate division CSSED10-310 bacterium TaxID=2855610 RepID=A0ABV6YWK4_UNCC1